MASACLVAVLDGEAEALEAGGVAGQLEDPEDPHDAKNLDHALQVLKGRRPERSSLYHGGHKHFVITNGSYIKWKPLP